MAYTLPDSTLEKEFLEGEMNNHRTGRKTLLIAFLSAAVAVNFLASACGIKKPQAPSWMTTWDLPLINHQYQVAEILDRFDDPNLTYDSLGNPGINITRDIDTVIVDGDLSFAGNTMNIRDTVGVIDIQSPSNTEATTYLNQIVPVDLGFVPPAPVDFSQPMAPMNGYTWASVLQGTINLTLFNNLEVSFDTLIVTVIDSIDMHTIGIATFEQGLAYLETETRQIDISGQTISNHIVILYHGHTPGGVLLNAGPQALEATAEFPENMTVTASLAETPEIVIQKSQVYYINDSTKVDHSVIEHGNLHIDILNDTHLPFFAVLQSSNFRENGNDFRTTRNLNPSSRYQIDIDLSGYDFIPTDGNPSQLVTVLMTNTVAPSAPEQYLVRATDSVSVHIDISEITFQTVTGRVEPIAVEIEPVSQDISLPDGVDQAQMNQGYIALTVENNSQIPAFLNMTIQGGGRTLHLDGPVAPKLSADAPPQVTVLTLGPDETAEFLNPPPATMTFSGTGIMNPDYDVVTINQNDMFTGRVNFSSTFSLTIRDTVEIEPEISSVSLDSRPDNLQDNLESGRFNAAMENHLPIGTMVTIYIGHRADSTLFTDPASLILGPYHLPPASVNGDGIVDESVLSQISDSLDAVELEIFNNDSLFFGQKIELLPTGNEGATLTGNDYVGIRAQARMHLMITE